MASSGSESDYEVEKFLKQRKHNGRIEYLVRWAGFGEHEDSWEPEKNLRHCAKALNEFKESLLTPSRVSTRRSLASTKVTETLKNESDSYVTKSSTRVVKQVTTRNTRSQQVDSESSSREGSPARRSTKFNPTVKQPTSLSFRAHCPRLTRMDIPMVVLLSCIMFIAVSFIVGN